MQKQWKQVLFIVIVVLFWTINLFAQTENWVYTYNGPGNGWDYAFPIIYGDDGNLYAAGFSQGSNRDLFVVSLTTAGDTNWTYTYNGQGNDDERARSIIYGDDGNLYLTGWIASSTAEDFAVISLTTDGDTNWTYTCNGDSSIGDRA